MEVSATDKITEAIQTAVNTDSSNINTDTQNQDPSVQSTDIADDFSAYLKTALGGETKVQVNEEELFSALIGQSLRSENEEAATHYEQERARFMVSMARADGYVSVEDVAMAALRSTVAEGKIDETTAEEINGKAFAAAQLDDNLTALYDSYGSAEDQTVAVATMDSALSAAKAKFEKIESGEVPVESRSLSAQSNSAPSTDSASAVDGSSGSADPGSAPSGSQSMDGSGGFLWKPESEADGNLVVLLPTSLKGLIDRVEIHSSLPPDSSTLLDEGRFAGDTHNGGRPHFRFDSPGESYGSDINLVVYKDSGETVSWQIGDGSQRYD